MVISTLASLKYHPGLSILTMKSSKWLFMPKKTNIITLFTFILHKHRQYINKFSITKLVIKQTFKRLLKNIKYFENLGLTDSLM